MKLKKEKGFTLIELLVVIAIIGVLSTLAVVSLNNARQKSRDSKRVGDVKQMQNALELYYNDAGGYPGTGGVTSTAPIKFGTVVYMQKVPLAPVAIDAPCTTTNVPYIYSTTNASSTTATDGSTVYNSYELTYCLGGTTGGISNGIHTASPAGMTY